LASIPSIPKTRPKKTASPPTSSIHDSGSNSANSATDINTIAPVIPSDRVEKVNSVETTQSEISEAHGIPSVPKTRPSGNQVSKKADSGTVESTSVVGKTEQVSFEVANLDGEEGVSETDEVSDRRGGEIVERLDIVENMEDKSAHDSQSKSMEKDPVLNKKEMTVEIDPHVKREEIDAVKGLQSESIVEENLTTTDASAPELHTQQTIQDLDELQREIEAESKRLESVKSELQESHTITEDINIDSALKNASDTNEEKSDRDDKPAEKCDPDETASDTVCEVNINSGSSAESEKAPDVASSDSAMQENIDHVPVLPPSRPKTSKKALESEPTPVVPVRTTSTGSTKRPPPVPKKPSSKIAAFQEMLQKQQQADMGLFVKHKPTIPRTRPTPKHTIERSSTPDSTDDGEGKAPTPDVDRSQSQFAQSLNGMIGVGLPGMAFGGNPFAAMKQARESGASDGEGDLADDKNEKSKVQDIRRSRARGPRGRKLPGEVNKSVEINDGTLGNKFSIVSCELWELDMSVSKPVEQEFIESSVDEATGVEETEKAEEAEKEQKEGETENAGELEDVENAEDAKEVDAGNAGGVEQITQGAEDVGDVHVVNNTEVMTKKSVLPECGNEVTQTFTEETISSEDSEQELHAADVSTMKATTQSSSENFSVESESKTHSSAVNEIASPTFSRPSEIEEASLESAKVKLTPQDVSLSTESLTEANNSECEEEAD
jgi:hypothetical protein